MSGSIGWHVDADDAHTTRYWDGTRWSAERHWDGTAWTDVPQPGARPAGGTFPAAASVATPDANGPAKAMTPASWLLFGGAAVATLGVFFPWESVSSGYRQISQTPTSVGGAVFLLIGLTTLVVVVGWPARTGRLTVARRVGLIVVLAAMAFFTFAKFNSIGDDQDLARSASRRTSSYSVYGYDSDQGTTISSAAGIDVSAGAGLYFWSVGTLVAIGGLVVAWRASSEPDADLNSSAPPQPF